MQFSVAVRVTRVLGIIVVATLSGLGSSRGLAAEPEAPASKEPAPAAAAPAEIRPAPAELKAWRKSMAKVPVPKKGCFTATYPKTEWQQVPCVTPPNRPYPPAPWPTSQVVGNGGSNDFSAQVASTISSAEGSFDSTGGITSETDSAANTANTYSLQLNSNPFASPICSGSPNPNCLGWQQFVYSNSNAGYTWMQYWLLRYNTTCPSGWNTFTFGGGSTDIYCWKNSAGGASVPVQPLSNIGNLNVTGTVVNGGQDSVSMTIGGTTYAASDNDNVLSLAAGWQTAEFNVFGDGGGSQANFNGGSHMIVRTSVNSGTTNAPTSVAVSFTGETNNFTLVPPSCPYGGAAPAVVFDESTNAGATSMCAGGTSIGDTHLTNINGLLYDFQATGDFLLAKTDPNFVVQTRQVSGAPTWPDASVNKAVAMKMGETRLAVCLEPTRFFVNGERSDLRDGKSLTLPGVYIRRIGNTYTFTRPNGENVRADLYSGWINVSVGLGHIPVARVTGLLGNANGAMGEADLAMHNGTLLKQPVSFDELYHRYGNSWRVTRNESLLMVCGEKNVERGVPKKLFYANDLDPKVYQRTRAVCEAAGVKAEALLDACTLDTAVLGKKEAARAFVRAPAPRAVLRPVPSPDHER